MLAFSTQVRGFKHGRSCRILKGEKILSTPSFRGEEQPSVPCRRFAACKRSLNVAWKSTFRQNYQTILAHRVPPFATRGLSRCVAVRGHLVAKAGTSKLWGDPGLHNKPLGCSVSEVYASGPGCEEAAAPYIASLYRGVVCQRKFGLPSAVSCLYCVLSGYELMVQPPN